MKKILLSLCLAHGIINAQNLLNDNFNSYTVGNIGTSVTGASAGQGNWYTNATSTDTGVTNASFQIVTNNATQDKVAKITGSASTLGSRYINKSITTLWAGRTTGNNIIQVEFDIFTGTATTSKNATRFYIYESTLGKILSGVSLAQDTKAIQGIAYYDASASGGSIGNYGFYLGGTATVPADIILNANSWVRVGIAFDKTTGNSYWKGPGFNGYVAGAASATDPAGLYMMAFSGGTGNTVSADHLFDNLTVTAVGSVNLLSTDETTPKLEQNFKIYPNPANDFITIDIKEKVLAVYAYDVNGRRTELKFEGNRIDVKNLFTGVYILGVKTEKGFVSQKLLKK